MNATKNDRLVIAVIFWVGFAFTAFALWRAADSWTAWAVVGASWMAFAAYARGEK